MQVLLCQTPEERPENGNIHRSRYYFEQDTDHPEMLNHEKLLVTIRKNGTVKEKTKQDNYSVLRNKEHTPEMSNVVS